MDKCSIFVHSQGGMAALHLYQFYHSCLEGTKVLATWLEREGGWLRLLPQPPWPRYPFTLLI